jgi:predicted transcriptional regulator of viral defense system
MEFRSLLELVGDEPLFDTSLLLAGDVQRAAIQRQLARWQRSGHVQQVRRGLYTLAPPYRRHTPHPFLVANRMVKASYVSCQSALAWYGLIPEYTPVTTSVTTVRPGSWTTPFGEFHFRHIKLDLWFGYRLVEVAADQQAFVAHQEKALLDLLYLTPEADDPFLLQELRLQNLEQLNLEQLRSFAKRTGSLKLQRSVQQVVKLANEQGEAFDLL